MATECLSCGGVYESVQADGTTYQHACPPVRAVRVKGSDGRERTALLSDVRVDDERLEELSVPRDNARDETVDPRAALVNGRRPLKAEGLGVREVPSPPRGR